ncbi:MAG: FAD-dependent oxidoreductase [Flavobacteriaceae bacterium]|nr:FAD-dependent oxidoreductase [Flavobacteriaceae bacterium]
MNDAKDLKIGIIGGGLMGLVLAYRLTQLNATVKVFERESQPGGLSTYYNYGKFIWDKFYHVIVPTDGSLIRLIEEIGLGSKLNWTRALTGYYVNRSFYPLNSPKDYFLFPLLNIWDKMRLAYTIFYGSRIDDWKKLEKITVKDWLIKMGGKRNFNKFWAPLLRSKLGKNYTRVSGVFIWTYIKRLFKAREYPVEKDYMGYVTGGYKTVFDKLEQLLNENNSNIHLETQVKSIKPAEGGGVNIYYEESVEHFDKVVFTAPLNVLEKVTDPGLCEVVNNEQAIEYQGVVCLVLTTNKPLTPYYILNMGDDNSPFTGVIGISTLVDQVQTAGQQITFFPKYIPADHPYWSKTDSELKALFLEGVKDLYPDFDESDIESSHINRAFKVQPLQVLNYSEIIPKIHTKHPDFFVLNTSQFVNDSVNNNSVVTHVNSFVDEYKHEFQSVRKR